MLSVHSVTYLSGSDTGTFSPYSDGEKGTGRNADAYSATLATGETIRDSCLSPRHYTGRNVRQDNEGQRHHYQLETGYCSDFATSWLPDVQTSSKPPLHFH